ncbi:MAG: DUF547 domain-containing protein [bacterium]
MSVILLFCTLFTSAYSDSSNFFNDVNMFLGKYVHDSKVNYKAIQQNPNELQKLVNAVRDFDVHTLKSEDQVKAFWINAYNILVIHSVSRVFPINSPLDVTGFFDKTEHVVAGKKLTLNDIENNELRKPFKDPRIHFALVCAALSCPPLIDGAYFGDKLEMQLDERTRMNLNDKNFIRVNRRTREVSLSHIFEWYEEDFISKDQALLDFINRYRAEKIPANFKVGFYEYNWKLNELKARDTVNRK